MRVVFWKDGMVLGYRVMHHVPRVGDGVDLAVWWQPDETVPSVKRRVQGKVLRVAWFDDDAKVTVE